MMEKQKNLDDAAYEVIVKLERAREVLSMMIDRFNLDSVDMSKEEREDFACCTGQVYNILEIIDDYMFDSYEELLNAME